MLLTERAIRQLIYNVLLEGVREDADALSALLTDAPEALSQFEPLSMKPKWVNWLADRYVRSKYPADDKLQDALPVIAAFAAADAAISQKYGSNPQFKTAVDTSFPPSERKWTNPADAAAMSTADMDTLLTIYKRPKDKLGIDRADTAWKNDEVGTFGPWKLYFPTNQQNSINIAGADPVTHKPYTTWCTARTAGSNLFNNYAGHGIMLFYAINTEATPEDPESRISIGFVRGKLEAGGQYGGITVNAVNNGLKDADLARIFGGYYTSIIARAEAVVAEHGGEHPVKTELDAAAQDVVKFKSMLRGLSDEEAGDLCRNVFGYGTKTVSLDVLIAAASHKSASVRARCAQNPSTPPHVFEKLAADPVALVRHEVARRAPLHVLEKLADDPDASVRYQVILREFEMPTPDFEKLADNPDALVRRQVARSRAPTHVLEKLADDPVAFVRVSVLYNKLTPLHVQEKLAFDSDKKVRRVAGIRAARSHKARPEILEQLSSSYLLMVRRAVARNPKTPLTALRALSQDKDDKTREAAMATLAKLQPMGETRRLAHRIIAELKRR
jgi:hypothetical protein